MKPAEPHDEADRERPQALTAGARFGRYEIVRMLGIGGMGSVFEATHAMLKKRVALKTMHSSLLRSEAARTRFLREAETVARVRHRNVVDISDVGIENGVPYLVMEYLEGEDLGHVLERTGPLSVEAAVDAVLPVVCGLVAVHRLGILHRDVKPENILLARDDAGAIVPKLLDFGVSKDLDRSTRPENAPNTVTGTPQYMSPEQSRGSAALDGRSDQYAIGVVLYQCLTGQLPFESPSLLELIQLIDNGEFRPLHLLRSDVPEGLCKTIERAMARHLRDRFESTREFGLALLPYASERMRKRYEDELAHVADADFPRNNAIALENLEELVSSRTLPHPPTRSGIRERGFTNEPKAGKTPAKRKLGTWTGVALVLMLGAGTAYFARTKEGVVATPKHPETPLSPTNYSVRLSVVPETTLIKLDGQPVATGNIDRTFKLDGATHTLEFSAEGYLSRSLSFRDTAPSESVVLLQKHGEAVSPNLDLEPAPLPHSDRTDRPSARRGRAPEAVPTEAPIDIQLSR